MLKKSSYPAALFFTIFLIYSLCLPSLSFGEQGKRHYIEEINKTKKALGKSPNDVSLLWNLARNYFHAGGRERSKKQKGKFFASCVHYAQKAVGYNDNSAEGHFYLGLCYGKQAEMKSIVKGLSLAWKIKNEMERVVELDPVLSDAGGHRVLGRLLFKLPRLLGGSKEKSRENLEKAVRIAPNFSTNHLYLAEVYLDEKEYLLALKEIKTVLGMPNDSGREKDLIKEKKKAEELLKEIPIEIRKSKVI